MIGSRAAPSVPAAVPPADGIERARWRFQVERILRVSRVVSDLARAEAFYKEIGFRTVAQAGCDAATLAAFGLPGAEAQEVVMRLGMDDVALVHFAVKGRPYPPDSRSNDLWFQHMAIVVGDMDAAYAHLCSCGGWSPISEGGPQLLPPSDGGVRAFKFRDPDGHPLELIWFPPGQGRAVWHRDMSGATFLGIDHSGLAIASTSKSGAFYRALGFGVCGRSLNHGPAQTRLDGLPGARVRVTGLRPTSKTGPGLELLGYQPAGRPAGPIVPDDLVTDWVTLAVTPWPGASPCAIRDPDGHLLLMTDYRGSTMLPA